MRTLKFIVNGQTISLDPTCNFEGLIPGTEGYLEAQFSFSKEWDNCIKVVAFFSNLGVEYEPQVLNRRNVCTIPPEALKNRVFKIQVLGQHNNVKIRTNKIAVRQEGRGDNI